MVLKNAQWSKKDERMKHVHVWSGGVAFLVSVNRITTIQENQGSVLCGIGQE